MLRQSFETLVGGQKGGVGIIGAFYCEQSAKVFTLVTLTNEPKTEEELLDDFESYSDSFDC